MMAINICIYEFFYPGLQNPICNKLSMCYGYELSYLLKDQQFSTYNAILTIHGLRANQWNIFWPEFSLIQQ